MGRRGHIAALWATLGLAGCFDKLPEPLACAGSQDCLPGESCVAEMCVRAVVEEDMDAPDMLVQDMNMSDMVIPDMNIPDIDTSDMSAPDMNMPDMNIPDMSTPDMNMPVTRDVEFFINDADDEPGVPVNYAGLAICLRGSRQYVYRQVLRPNQKIVIPILDDAIYDIVAARTDIEPFYEESVDLNVDGISIPNNYTVYLKSCQGEGVTCNESALSECYKSAFNGPYYMNP